MASSKTRVTPERLYRLLADNATDVVSLHDPCRALPVRLPVDHRLRGIRPRRAARRRRAGRSCTPTTWPACSEAMAVAFAVGEVATIRYRLRHFDGHWEWAETTARSVGAEIQCSTRKITELHHRLAQQSAVARLGNMVMRGPDLDEVFEEATRAVAETLDVDLVSITEHLGDGPREGARGRRLARRLRRLRVRRWRRCVPTAATCTRTARSSSRTCRTTRSGEPRRCAATASCRASTC